MPLVGDGARSTLSSFIFQDEKKQTNLQGQEDLKLYAATTVAYVKGTFYGNTYSLFFVHREYVHRNRRWKHKLS